jgi:hypothetical protein
MPFVVHQRNRVPIDEVRLYKINQGFPHAEIYAAGYYCGSKVIAVMGDMRADPFQAYDAAMRGLYRHALLIYPDGRLTARGNVKTVVD